MRQLRQPFTLRRAALTAALQHCTVVLRDARQLTRAPLPQVNILDMRGLAVASLAGKALELTGKIAKIDQDHYPETLEACYIINPPWAFSAAFGLVTRFLNENTRKKIQARSPGLPIARPTSPQLT